MFISRVKIDLYNRKKTKDLSCVDAYHNWVERSFPIEISQKSRTRKLWRIDTINNEDYLIIVSEEKPDINWLEMYGVTGSTEIRKYDGFISMLKNGMRLRFRIALNPVKTFSNGKGRRGRTKPLYKIDDQIIYLLERAEKNGFLINKEEFSVVERSYVILKKSEKKFVKLNKAIYEGVLTVSNIDIFKNILKIGIGKHKAYGFGMMTVIPLEQ